MRRHVRSSTGHTDPPEQNETETETETGTRRGKGRRSERGKAMAAGALVAALAAGGIAFAVLNDRGAPPGGAPAGQSGQTDPGGQEPSGASGKTDDGSGAERRGQSGESGDTPAANAEPHSITDPGSGSGAEESGSDPDSGNAGREPKKTGKPTAGPRDDGGTGGDDAENGWPSDGPPGMISGRGPN
ncbi:hypothetical protein [Spongiactinospora sp. TRM90649]|uniref:hypothetical protein n=1 Tax=Spongiactinospora sp. TRM90649 TaxID=3031114 RepID=UPI0023F7EE96|nr:hypothetical protein [Spongiactinospora sp. TRM90649]MDF5754064.1 hypothetical protein [Spongiactinospora sp. TRM90649]